MQVLDDEGRLFGVLNVVDALVILLFIAVLIAGLALVTGGQEYTDASTYVTIDLGSQPTALAQRIDEGDTYSPPGSRDNLTITDVYLAPEGEEARAIVQARLAGTAFESPAANVSVQYLGDLPQLGRELDIETRDYNVSGSIRDAGDSSSLERETQNVVVTDVIDSTDARAIAPGDTYELAGQTVASVESVEVFGTNDPGRVSVRVGLSLQTIRVGEQTRFGGTQLRQGSTVPFETDAYNLEGTIQRVGTTDLARDTQTVVVTDVLDTTDAEAITAGDTYEVAGQTIGTVESVQVYSTGTPGRVAVRVGLSLQTIRVGQQNRFGATVLQKGATVPFQTDAYTLESQIERVGTATLERETRQVLISDVIDATDAEAISVGDTFDVAGQTIATVESVETASTGNPDRERVFVGLSLQTISVGDRDRFGDTILQKGASVPFHTDAYDLQGTIERLDAIEQRGSPATREVTLQMKDVPPTRADMIEVGMTDRAGGETLAELVDVHREPSKVVLTSDSGDIFLHDHPLNQDLLLTATLKVRQTTDGIRFKGETIQRGSEITLAFGDTTVRATVIGL